MRILLVRLRSIGDVVFTTPLLGALRRSIPGAHLTYVIEPGAAPVLAHSPDIDDLLVVPRHRGVDRLRADLATGRRLARGRFDVAIDLHGGPRSAWFTWASRAPMRIGYTIPWRTWMYTHAVPRGRALTRRHSVLDQWDLLAPLGIAHGDPDRNPVRMAASPEADARVLRRLGAAGVDARHTLVVVHVSASNRFKRWPEASFTSLVVSLARRDPDRRVVLVSGPSDVHAAGRIAGAARASLGERAFAVVDLGPLELSDLRALIARAGAYIGGDSGPMHVAATTSAPIVAVLGPTLADRCRPWRDARVFTEVVDAGELPCRPCHQRTCAPGDFRCLTRVGPERVLAAVERALPQPTTASPVTGRSQFPMRVAHA